jgi:hypothetical protein
MRYFRCNACLTMHKETERCDMYLWCHALCNRLVSVMKESRTSTLLLTSAVTFRNCELNRVLRVAMETNKQKKLCDLSVKHQYWKSLGFMVPYKTCFETSSLCCFIATRKRYFLGYKLETTINFFFFCVGIKTMFIYDGVVVHAFCC